MSTRKYTSKALIKFEQSTWDVYHVFDICEDIENSSNVDMKSDKLDILVKNTYLSITTCWESYIEDLCKESYYFLMSATLPGKSWIRTVSENRLNELIKSFHTPSSSNINNLYYSTLGLSDLSNSWIWSNMPTTSARTRLGDYIKVRGSIAHRTDSSHELDQEKAEKYLEFVRILAFKTESRIRSFTKRVTGANLGVKI